jgi:predicted AlkP superfamily pyrophosphatase or phosphodiesterase
MLNGVFFAINMMVLAVTNCIPVISNNQFIQEGKEPLQFIVIGVDGMSPDGILNSITPNMDRLMTLGSYSLTASAILPTSSSPNWASMIMGSPPAVHGIESNRWDRKDIVKDTFCGGDTGETVPTIFRVLREQYPDKKIACFHDWNDFGRLVEPGITSKIKDLKGPENTMHSAIKYIENEKPFFTFIHLDHVDHAGHRYGHGSKKYYQAVSKADELIGDMLSALQENGLWESSFVLVTSDHGGKGRGHGGDSPEEVTIPWILFGPGIPVNLEIKSHISTIDTAPTIAHCLGATTPDCWTGNLVKELFELERHE